MKKLILISSLYLAACEPSGPISYVKIAGGGIQFNYRVSEASMVMIAQQTYPMPDGSTLEALFDLPGTSKRQSVTLPTMDGKLTYRFQSQRLFNIVKNGKYLVTIRLLDKQGKILDSKDTVFTSDQDQSTLPTKPLVKDLALTPNP